MTTMRGHSHLVDDNLLNSYFNPSKPNQAWACDKVNLRIHLGWIYLAEVIGLGSRRIIGWSIYKLMTVNLTLFTMQIATNLRRPKIGIIFHSN